MKFKQFILLIINIVILKIHNVKINEPILKLIVSNQLNEIIIQFTIKSNLKINKKLIQLLNFFKYLFYIFKTLLI